MALKDVIKEARLKKNLKQEDAAKLTGVTVQTYSKWENGKTEPKASQVAQISKILNVSTHAICYGEKSRKMEALDFMRNISKLAKHRTEFDIRMAAWKCINDDYHYINILKSYGDASENNPAFDEIDIRDTIAEEGLEMHIDQEIENERLLKKEEANIIAEEEIHL